MPSCLFLADRPYPRRIRLDIGSDSRPVWLAVSLTDAELHKCSSRWKRGRQKYEARSTHQVFSSQKLTIILESYLASSLQSSLPEKQKPSFPIHDTRGLVFTNSTRAWITLTFLSASFLLYCNRLQEICHPVIKLCCSLFRYNP